MHDQPREVLTVADGVLTQVSAQTVRVGRKAGTRAWRSLTLVLPVLTVGMGRARPERHRQSDSPTD
jgi:hypothetical protein